MLEQKPNPIKIGCFLILLAVGAGGHGGGVWQMQLRGTLFGLFRESGYYSEIGTMAPWEQPPLSLKLSYIIAIVIGILSECM